MIEFILNAKLLLYNFKILEFKKKITNTIYTKWLS